MLSYLSKLLIILICIIFLSCFAYLVPPPNSWQEATDWQIAAVFLPLLILFTFIIDLFVKYFPRSFIVGLGLMFIVVLQAISLLTPLLIVGILAAFILMARLFPKRPTPRFIKRLT